MNELQELRQLQQLRMRRMLPWAGKLQLKWYLIVVFCFDEFCININISYFVKEINLLMDMHLAENTDVRMINDFGIDTCG